MNERDNRDLLSFFSSCSAYMHNLYLQSVVSLQVVSYGIFWLDLCVFFMP